MKIFLASIIVLAAVIAAAGCTGSNTGGQDVAQGSLRAHYDYTESWGITLGCYGRVNGYIYNTGSAPVDNVMLSFNLVNTRTGAIRDSRQVFLGTMDAGQSRTYDVILDGECTQEYHVEPVFGE